MFSTFWFSGLSDAREGILLAGAESTLRLRGIIKTLENGDSNSMESFMINVTGMIFHTFSWKISS